MCESPEYSETHLWAYSAQQFGRVLEMLLAYVLQHLTHMTLYLPTGISLSNMFYFTLKQRLKPRANNEISYICAFRQFHWLFLPNFTNEDGKKEKNSIFHLHLVNFLQSFLTWLSVIFTWVKIRSWLLSVLMSILKASISWLSWYKCTESVLSDIQKSTKGALSIPIHPWGFDRSHNLHPHVCSSPNHCTHLAL